MITSCGGLSNDPIMGTQEMINYNLVLALHQLGYAMRSPPKNSEIKKSVYCKREEDPEMIQKVDIS